MERILLINDGKYRWSTTLEIIKNEDKYGGLRIRVVDQFEDEAEEHIITVVAHHGEAEELIQKLISVSLA